MLLLSRTLKINHWIIYLYILFVYLQLPHMIKKCLVFMMIIPRAMVLKKFWPAIETLFQTCDLQVGIFLSTFHENHIWFEKRCQHIYNPDLS